MFKWLGPATLIRLCMLISNSIVMAGLFYGFLTAGTLISLASPSSGYGRRK